MGDEIAAALNAAATERRRRPLAKEIVVAIISAITGIFVASITTIPPLLAALTKNDELTKAIDRLGAKQNELQKEKDSLATEKTTLELDKQRLRLQSEHAIDLLQVHTGPKTALASQSLNAVFVALEGFGKTSIAQARESASLLVRFECMDEAARIEAALNVATKELDNFSIGNREFGKTVERLLRHQERMSTIAYSDLDSTGGYEALNGEFLDIQTAVATRVSRQEDVVRGLTRASAKIDAPLKVLLTNLQEGRTGPDVCPS